MEKVTVLKFGGSSVADDKKLTNVANKIIDFYNKEKKIIVILSAQGKTTDKLIEESLQLSKNPNKREQSQLLACGEQMSVAKLAILLNELGVKAISLTAWQVRNKK